LGRPQQGSDHTAIAPKNFSIIAQPLEFEFSAFLALARKQNFHEN
jgi:hypothetical protein